MLIFNEDFNIVPHENFINSNYLPDLKFLEAIKSIEKDKSLNYSCCYYVVFVAELENNQQFIQYTTYFINKNKKSFQKSISIIFDSDNKSAELEDFDFNYDLFIASNFPEQDDINKMFIKMNLLIF
jgi:hypothetical protein